MIKSIKRFIWSIALGLLVALEGIRNGVETPMDGVVFLSGYADILIETKRGANGRVESIRFTALRISEEIDREEAERLDNEHSYSDRDDPEDDCQSAEDACYR